MKYDVEILRASEMADSLSQTGFSRGYAKQSVSNTTDNTIAFLKNSLVDLFNEDDVKWLDGWHSRLVEAAENFDQSAGPKHKWLQQTDKEHDTFRNIVDLSAAEIKRLADWLLRGAPRDTLDNDQSSFKDAGVTYSIVPPDPEEDSMYEDTVGTISPASGKMDSSVKEKKLRKAHDFIERSTDTPNAEQIGRHIGVSAKTFRTDYAPVLKEKHGVQSSTGANGGYFIK